MTDLTAQLLPRLKSHRLPSLTLDADFVIPAYANGSILNIGSTLCEWYGLPPFKGASLAPEIVRPLKDAAPAPRNIILLLVDALARTPEERELVAVSDRLRILKALFELKLTPEQFAEVRKDPEAFDLAGIEGFLNRQIMDLDAHYERTLFWREQARLWVREAMRFYELSYERDRHFVTGMLEKMREEEETKSVFVSGGYHTPHVTRLLRSQGVSYAVITPQVLHPTDYGRYEKLLLSRDGSDGNLSLARHGGQKKTSEDALMTPYADPELLVMIGARLGAARHEVLRDIAEPGRRVAEPAADSGARLSAGRPEKEIAGEMIRRLENGERVSVYIVCWANMNRSVVLELLLRHWFRVLGIKNVYAASAGINTFKGASIDPDIKKALREFGVEDDILEDFRSRSLDRISLRDAGYVLVAEDRYKEELLRRREGRIASLPDKTLSFNDLDSELREGYGDAFPDLTGAEGDFFAEDMVELVQRTLVPKFLAPEAREAMEEIMGARLAGGLAAPDRYEAELYRRAGRAYEKKFGAVLKPETAVDPVRAGHLLKPESLDEMAGQMAGFVLSYTLLRQDSGYVRALQRISQIGPPESEKTVVRPFDRLLKRTYEHVLAISLRYNIPLLPSRRDILEYGLSAAPGALLKSHPLKIALDFFTGAPGPAEESSPLTIGEAIRYLEEHLGYDGYGLNLERFMKEKGIQDSTQGLVAFQRAVKYREQFIRWVMRRYTAPDDPYYEHARREGIDVGELPAFREDGLVVTAQPPGLAGLRNAREQVIRDYGRELKLLERASPAMLKLLSSNDPEARDIFQRAARGQTTLYRHEQLVKKYGALREEKKRLIADMERVSGRPGAAWFSYGAERRLEALREELKRPDVLTEFLLKNMEAVDRLIAESDGGKEKAARLSKPVVLRRPKGVEGSRPADTLMAGRDSSPRRVYSASGAQNDSRFTMTREAARLSEDLRDHLVAADFGFGRQAALKAGDIAGRVRDYLEVLWGATGDEEGAAAGGDPAAEVLREIVGELEALARSAYDRMDEREGVWKAFQVFKRFHAFRAKLRKLGKAKELPADDPKTAALRSVMSELSDLARELHFVWLPREIPEELLAKAGEIVDLLKEIDEEIKSLLHLSHRIFLWPEEYRELYEVPEFLAGVSGPPPEAELPFLPAESGPRARMLAKIGMVMSRLRAVRAHLIDGDVQPAWEAAGKASAVMKLLLRQGAPVSERLLRIETLSTARFSGPGLADDNALLRRHLISANAYINIAVQFTVRGIGSPETDRNESALDEIRRRIGKIKGPIRYFEGFFLMDVLGIPRRGSPEGVDRMIESMFPPDRVAEVESEEVRRKIGQERRKFRVAMTPELDAAGIIRPGVLEEVLNEVRDLRELLAGHPGLDPALGEFIAAPKTGILARAEDALEKSVVVCRRMNAQPEDAGGARLSEIGSTDYFENLYRQRLHQRLDKIEAFPDPAGLARIQMGFERLGPKPVTKTARPGDGAYYVKFPVTEEYRDRVEYAQRTFDVFLNYVFQESQD